MSYYAYFLGKEPNPARPITFIYNGGPGSSTIWLHMGAFGPKRVVTREDSHTPAAPYRLVDNEASLLPESDLVFIDAPSTGFGHLRGTDKEKAFLGVDQDAHAFANFIVEFLSRHGRWNSPKYLFGESYGTTRSAVLANILQEEKSIDLNGVILLSQILAFDNSADGPEFNPGVDQPYALALADLCRDRLVPQASAQSARGAGAVHQGSRGLCSGRIHLSALAQGSALSPERRAAIIAKAPRLHGPAGRLHRARGPANQRRRLCTTPARRSHHRPHRRALLGSDDRFARQGRPPTIRRPRRSLRRTSPPSTTTCAAISSSARARPSSPTTTPGIGESWDFSHKPPGS